MNDWTTPDLLLFVFAVLALATFGGWLADRLERP